MEKKLGILGGMGPMASQLFYKMITQHTKAGKDQDHIEIMVYSDSKMPDRTGAILAGEYHKVDERMRRDAQLLADCGCEAICVTCNTAHFFVDRIKDGIPVPFIHMIRETSAAMAESFPGGKIGIMATDGTVSTNLYQNVLKEYGLVPFTPCEEIQKQVMHQIYDCIKAGKPYDEESWTKIENEFKAAGCSSVLLACTELSIIKADEDLDDWYVDPMLVMARKAVEFCEKEWV